MKALIIRQPWIDLILSGKKTWEIRGSSTKTRGEIALIESGTGLVVGVCGIEGALGPLTLAQLKAATREHRVTARQIGNKKPYAKTFAWVLSGARRLVTPVKYKHPQGAVIWVNLPTAVVRAIEKTRKRA